MFPRPGDLADTDGIHRVGICAAVLESESEDQEGKPEENLEFADAI